MIFAPLGGAALGDPGSTGITVFSIASGEAFETDTLVTADNYEIDPTGIATAEAFGTLTLSAVISPTGIVSGEAFDTSAFVGEVVIYEPVSIADSGHRFRKLVE